MQSYINIYFWTSFGFLGKLLPLYLARKIIDNEMDIYNLKFRLFACMGCGAAEHIFFVYGIIPVGQTVIAYLRIL